MLTVRTLLEETGLDLASGAEGADGPVRWVHITELVDPTPWLTGGELILTTGIALHAPETQRGFVERLAAYGIAGLGFGTGFDHPELPPALLDAARELAFPLFEVPYSLPFIALTERAFSRIVNEQYALLQRASGVHRRLERLVLEERGLAEIVRAVAAAVGATVLVLGPRGELRVSRAFRRALSDDALRALTEEVERRTHGGDPAAAFSPEHPELGAGSLALPVTAAGDGRPAAWLVAVREVGGLGEFERLALQGAVTVVALELMRERVVRTTERRLAGDVLAEALDLRLDPQELAGRLRPFGVGPEASVLVFGGEGVCPAPAHLERALAEAGATALVAARDSLLCAVVDGRGPEPLDLAARLRAALEDGHPVRVGASRVLPVREVRRGFHEARLALEAATMRGASATTVASHRDLGAFQLLLAVQDEDALRLYCDGVLGPIEAGGQSAGLGGEDLLRSVEAFIEENGQWERAARRLFCHRHTLRYRIRRVEELTGRDLARVHDRIELWLALRGRELVK